MTEGLGSTDCGDSIKDDLFKVGLIRHIQIPKPQAPLKTIGYHAKTKDQIFPLQIQK